MKRENTNYERGETWTESAAEDPYFRQTTAQQKTDSADSSTKEHSHYYSRKPRVMSSNPIWQLELALFCGIGFRRNEKI